MKAVSSHIIVGVSAGIHGHRSFFRRDPPNLKFPYNPRTDSLATCGSRVLVWPYVLALQKNHCKGEMSVLRERKQSRRDSSFPRAFAVTAHNFDLVRMNSGLIV